MSKSRPRKLLEFLVYYRELKKGSPDSAIHAIYLYRKYVTREIK